MFEANRQAHPAEIDDVALAFTLLAIDPSLQGIALWGEDGSSSTALPRALAQYRATITGGPREPVRLPVYASPSDLLSRDAAVPEPLLTFASSSHGHQTLPRGHGSGFTTRSRPRLIDRARRGLLLIESADLLSHATAAALRRALASLPTRERPLVIARARTHPNSWSLLANWCGLWVPNEPGTHPGIHLDRALLRDRDPEPEALLDGETLAQAQLKLARIEPSQGDVRRLVDGVPSDMDEGHAVDRFVVRTALAMAAWRERQQVTREDESTAFRLVLAARLANRGVESSLGGKPSTNMLVPAASTQSSVDSPANGTANGIDHRKADADTTADGATRDTVGTPLDGAGHHIADGPTHGTPNAPTWGARTSTADGTANNRARVPTDSPASHVGEPGGNPAPARLIVVPPAELGQIIASDKTNNDGHWPRNHPPRHRIRPISRSSTLGRPLPRTSPHRKGQPLALEATLLAAWPWQKLRRRTDRDVPPGRRFEIRPQDLRGRPRRSRPKTLYILAVDGSGSMAQGRMHLAKGAALSILADAYKGRRWVALIDFRGTAATLLYPPGRSSTTVRRLLVDLPAGGGTPLPAALALALDVGGRWQRSHEGGFVRVVLFTDGKGNVPLGDSRGGPPHGPPRRLEAHPAAAPHPTQPDAEQPLPPAPTPGLSTGRAGIRRALVRDDVDRLSRRMGRQGFDLHVVSSEGWRPGPDAVQLAAQLGATIVHIDRRPGSARRQTPGKQPRPGAIDASRGP